MVKIDDTDIDNVKLTFSNVGKIAAFAILIVSIAGSYFHLLSRQDSFEQTQDLRNQAVIEQINELKTDARATKEIIQQMNHTLIRTNIILEQMEKRGNQ